MRARGFYLPLYARAFHFLFAEGVLVRFFIISLGGYLCEGIFIFPLRVCVCVRVCVSRHLSISQKNPTTLAAASAASADWP